MPKAKPKTKTKTKKQTRRAISVRGDTYTQIKTWCEQNHTTMSQWVEARAQEWFAAPAEPEPIRQPLEKIDLTLADTRHFTF